MSGDHPYAQAKRELRCDEGEHEEVLFVTGGGSHYGRCCKVCGVKVGDWIPHDELSESQKAEAIEDRDEIKEAFREKISERADEIREEETPSFDRLCPQEEADPSEWRTAFEIVKNDVPSQNGDEFFWLLYDEYMDSKAWSETRDRVLREKGKRCKAQLSVCEEEATQIHHTSYDHVGTEPLWHLMPVCEACHEVLHHRDAPQPENKAGEVEEKPRSSGDSEEAKPSVSYDDLFGTSAPE